MTTLRRRVRPALMVMAGLCAAAAVSASVPATATHTPAGVQAHARSQTGAMAHARVPYRLT